MTSRVAVLVDGDNISADQGAQIIAVAEGYGRVDVARVYADLRGAPKWAEDCRFRPVHSGCGKNASDMLLVIDAMELALTGGIGTFLIASSDQDFTHVVRRLRELGRTAIGLGEAKTSPGFRVNCSDFVELGAEQGAMTPPPVSELDRKIRAMIAVHSRQGQGMALTSLGARLHAEHGTRISTYPERTWRAYLEARPCLYDLDPRGPKAMVRFRPDGFAARAGA